jgi:dihydrofolate reductase
VFIIRSGLSAQSSCWLDERLLKEDFVIRLIAAIDAKLGVANDAGIPWQGKISMDTQYFQEQTAEGVIVMGYATYKEFDQPLHDRTNFVATRPDTGAMREGFAAVVDLTQFLDEHARELVWVIGGAGLFARSLGRADQFFLTQLDADFNCTKFFPAYVEAFDLVSELGPHVENDISFTFQTWQRAHS